MFYDTPINLKSIKNPSEVGPLTILYYATSIL